MIPPWFKKSHAPPERVKEDSLPLDVLTYTSTTSPRTAALGLPESAVPVAPARAESAVHCQGPRCVCRASQSCALRPRT